MSKKNLLWGASLLLPVFGLACAVARQTPQPSPEVQQLSFEIQTATPTTPAVLSLVEPSVSVSTPKATATLEVTATETLSTPQEVSAAEETTTTQAVNTTTEVEEAVAEDTAVEEDPPPAPTVTPTPTEPVPTAEPLQGGEWDFEMGFAEWTNPFGDACPGSGLAAGWTAFTTRDQFGSSCFNETTWADNVFTGGSAQEITFAYVGNQAGVFKSAPAVPGHRFTVTAHMRREFSPSKVELSLGIDPGGGINWEAETVQWFPWQEDFDNQWSKTEETITATGENITIFIKGSHPYPEPGGALRIDSISIVDAGPEGN